MNIAIITVYQPFANLGSFLQAYALKIYLEKQGHNVRFIKTSSHFKSAFALVSTPRPYRSYFLRVQKAIYSLRDLMRLSYIDCSDSTIDCYIWGSDEIWNVTNKFFCRPIFWGKGVLSERPKIGYAISAGHATAIDFRNNLSLTEGAKDFKCILSRDTNTKQLLQEVFGINTQLVVDPTLLVKVDELSEKIPLPKYKYLLVYTYGIDGAIIELLRKFAEKHRLKIVSPFFWHIWADKTIECSALQFSSLIANAEYVFTTTFHGAVFSLINHSRCCILPMRQKVRSLCETLKCESRLISSDCSYEEFEMVISKPFDAEAFEINLSQLRTLSTSLLTTELKGIENEKSN